MKYTEMEELVGKTFTSIKKSDDEILFTDVDGNEYKMYHEQDCCEDVHIDDVNGDLDDLIGTPIISASERTQDESMGYDSCTWTFYHFSTIKGNVMIKWIGTSNGYYSEAVSFIKISK